MKPKILYHASQNRALEILEPRAKTIRDKDEGLVVFATSDKAEASKFIVPSDDSWTRKMYFGNVHVYIIVDRERYEKVDKGGSIYYLSSDTFENDKTKGTRTEWTSKVAVKPFRKEDYKSGFHAQMDSGVQIYFVDIHTFEKINKSNDHGNSIIRSLKSENTLKNINPLRIPYLGNFSGTKNVK